MYSLERNTRVYMKDEDAPTSPTRKSALSSGSRPSSSSPLQELQSNNRSSSAAHRGSNQALYTNGKDNCNGTTHHSQTKSLKHSQHRAVSSELGDLSAPGETKTKSQMARAFQESEEVIKKAGSKGGLQTVLTRRVVNRRTEIIKGENEKVRSVDIFFSQASVISDTLQ